MKPRAFTVTIAAIALAGTIWLYERQLLAREQTALATQRARAARMLKQFDALERERVESIRVTGAWIQEIQREAVTHNTDLASSADRQAQADTWRAQVRRLRALFELHPDQSIPELGLLTDLDWLDLARQIPVERDERRAQAQVRDGAIRKFMGALRDVARDYRTSNGSGAVSDLALLAPLFKPAIDPAILARYEIVVDSLLNASRSRQVIVERVPIDEEFDTRHYVTTDGSGSGSGPWITRPLRRAREQGIAAYAAANPGATSTKAADTLPFVQDPLDRGFLEAIAAYEDANNGRSSDDPSAFLPYATHPEARALLERMARAAAAKRTP